MTRIATLQKISTQAISICLLLSFAGATYPASNESIPAGEAAATQKLVQLIANNVRKEAVKGSARRDVHIKSHGCVKATFSVLPNLPEKLGQGIFSKPTTYSAWIRYSNGAGKIQDDAIGDGRGMAIKLMGVDSSPSGTRDFLMINYPVFFVRNVVDYLAFQSAVFQDNPIKFFFPGFNPFNFRLHELGIVNAIRDIKLSNPLDSQYWSMTAYSFGNTAMKFSARPCATLPQTTQNTTTPNFLRDNMQNQLAQGDACFDFMVQRQTDPLQMPIEDPTIEWREADSPFVPVAKITIPRQTFTSPEQLAFCENLSFTPWHTIPEFTPLGGINRVRKAVYETVSRIRHELNAVPRIEPNSYD